MANIVRENKKENRQFCFKMDDHIIENWINKRESPLYIDNEHLKAVKLGLQKKRSEVENFWKG